MCGGAAYALMRLYRLFDYKSHLVNMGKPEYATHVVALVYINVDGKKVLSIQDALFDISYTTIDGHPMDYFEMLTNLRNLDHKQIKAVPSNKWEVQRSIIIKSNENAIYNWIEIPRQFVPLGEDRRLYRATMSFDLFGKVSTYAQSFKEFVARLGYPGNLLYIYLFPFQVDECTLENLISKSRCEGEEAGILEEALKIARGTVQ